MKKYLSFALAAALLVSLLAGCSLLGGISEEDLAGSWSVVKPDTQEEAMGLLENIEAYEEEIALADLNSLEYVKILEFHTDGSYCFRYDVEATKECVREYYDAYFSALYEGRATLEAAYEEAFSDMTQAEFRQFFAELYSCTDYIEMLDFFVEIAYDYEGMEEPLETGTFRVSGDEVWLTVTGESVEESIGVELDENTMTVTYSDGAEIYTKK